jgi:hypothetical protein
VQIPHETSVRVTTSSCHKQMHCLKTEAQIREEEDEEEEEEEDGRHTLCRQRTRCLTTRGRVGCGSPAHDLQAVRDTNAQFVIGSSMCNVSTRANMGGGGGQSRTERESAQGQLPRQGEPTGAFSPPNPRANQRPYCQSSRQRKTTDKVPPSIPAS